MNVEEPDFWATVTVGNLAGVAGTTIELHAKGKASAWVQPSEASPLFGDGATFAFANIVDEFTSGQVTLKNPGGTDAILEFMSLFSSMTAFVRQNGSPVNLHVRSTTAFPPHVAVIATTDSQVEDDRGQLAARMAEFDAKIGRPVGFEPPELGSAPAPSHPSG